MNNYIQNNKRIAKNTLMLYIRTFLIILVSLYTSRVVLNTLGETDFGVYNIVGGVVILFSFIQGAMASATQRFLNFELGQGTDESIKKIFSMSMTAHISIALLVFILAQTLGLWFVTTQLNIPTDRVYAVHWVYQFSVLTTCINILRVPYHATIVAYERMDFYAYISIFEAALKLLIVYLLLVSSFDKLIVYSALLFGVALVTTLCYKIYCNSRFNVSRYKFFWDLGLYRQLMSFSGWVFIGSLSVIGATQGINILFNIFGGVLLNAAMAIAMQVDAAVYAFGANFQTAFSPQLVKSYAAGENTAFSRLICQTSKYSFFLMYLLALPLLICSKPILSMWLGELPEYAVQFTDILLLCIIVGAPTGPFWIAIHATGKVKTDQIAAFFIQMSVLPIGYALLYWGLSPIWVLVAKLVLIFVLHIFRVFYLQNVANFPAMPYLCGVMMQCLTVALLVPIFPLILRNFVFVNDDLWNVAAIICASVLSFCLFVYVIGIDRTERRFLLDTLRERFSAWRSLKE